MKTLKKIATVLLLTGALTVAENTTSAIYYANEANLINSKAFVTELKSIQETRDITFSNEELKAQIEKDLGYELTSENIKQVTKLSLNLHGQEMDLQDLKYFTNLEEIIINKGTFDASDLRYNQSLTTLTVVGCEVSNTNQLPNSIETLSFLSSFIKDHLLYVPYNTSFVYMMQTGFNNIHLKNPKVLRYINVDSNICTIDLAFLEECPNLIQVAIQACPNVTNAKALTTLSKYCLVRLDDYAPIWLTQEEYDSIKALDERNPLNLRDEIIFLDNLAQELTKDCETDADKLIQISNFIITNLEYSEEVLTDSSTKADVATLLNESPIKYAISANDDVDEVCINYACLFQALANRCGLLSTQLMSKNHTWNLVNGNYVDLTSLDGSQFIIEGDENIYSFEELIASGKNMPESTYYVRPENLSNEAYQEQYEFKQITDIDTEIGYISPNKVQKTDVKIFQWANNFAIALLAVSFMNYLKKVNKQIKFKRLKKDIDKKLQRH